MADVIFSRYLDTAGNGTGTKEATGDYSVTAEGFYIEPSPNVDMGNLQIARIIVFIEDSQNWSANGYGDITAGLTNGIELKVFNEDDSVAADLTDGIPIKSNADWHSKCHDVTYTSYGVGNDFLSVRWTFTKAGKPITLGYGERLEVMLNDDLTGLVSHRFLAQGIKLDINTDVARQVF